jgi:cardiolipin synthase
VDILSITLTLQQILSLLIAIYICIVVGVILLDNRAPQSTFAWLFLMVAFPILGFLVYLFFGRNYKAFSNENKLARIGGLSSLYGQVIQPLRAVQMSMLKSSGVKNPSRIVENYYPLSRITHLRC